MDIVDELRDVADDLAHRAADKIERMRNALMLMTQVEPCDCGCGGNKPVLMKPHHYYAIAKEALGNGTDESRGAGQTGPCARAHVTPANSDADRACCDSVPFHKAKRIKELLEKIGKDYERKVEIERAREWAKHITDESP